MGTVVPVLRMFDEAATQAFYVDFLGAKILFDHRFGDAFPLYMAVEVEGCEMHLSGHHGDACPGSHIRLDVADVNGMSKRLRNKDYRFAKPGEPEKSNWGTLELTLTDPSGNRLTFVEDL